MIHCACTGTLKWLPRGFQVEDWLSLYNVIMKLLAFKLAASEQWVISPHNYTVGFQCAAQEFELWHHNYKVIVWQVAHQRVTGLIGRRFTFPPGLALTLSLCRYCINQRGTNGWRNTKTLWRKHLTQNKVARPKQAYSSSVEMFSH